MKSFKDYKPQIDQSVFIAENAVIIGDVEIGQNSSIWYGVTIRGDINKIVIGVGTNIQDHTVIHVDSKKENSDFGQTIIGNYVTVGHGAILHACTIEDYCLIGMGAIILSGSKIGRGSIVAAGALVKENQIIPPYSLVIGVPANIKAALPETKIEELKAHANHYIEMAREHKLLSKTNER